MEGCSGLCAAGFLVVCSYEELNGTENFPVLSEGDQFEVGSMLSTILTELTKMLFI